MNTAIRRSTGKASALLLGVACACFCLQQLLVPVHLALHDHSPANASHDATPEQVTHGHAHGEHAHGEPEPADPEPPHKPHPVDDHLQELAEAPVSAILIHTPIALGPVRLWLPGFDVPSFERPRDSARLPRPPPPRASATPRAPPVAS